MGKHKSEGTVLRGVQIAKWPAWTTLPGTPVQWIDADVSCVEAEIDINDVGRVRIKPGCSVNVADIRYGYGR